MKKGIARTELDNLLRKIRLVVFDFDGVFTDNRVIVSERGEESVLCCRSDGLGLKRLREYDVKTLILSSEPNKVVRKRAEKLQIECRHDVKNKLNALRDECARRRVQLSQVAYVGNDINDADCLSAVGLPVVVGDAWDEVKPLAMIVLGRNGGHGAVREFCDMVWRVRREE
jgi:3-deoxy-D-manno-octulosonate 8-phosphate phosphatase (KDO 8-P phosphatase)